jgi:hypothetical protein
MVKEYMKKCYALPKMNKNILITKRFIQKMKLALHLATTKDKFQTILEYLMILKTRKKSKTLQILME